MTKPTQPGLAEAAIKYPYPIAALENDTQRLMGWFQAIEDNGGNRYMPPTARIVENRLRLFLNLIWMGNDIDTSRVTARALSDCPHREKQATSSVEQIMEEAEPATSGGGSGSTFSAAKRVDPSLIAPGPEDILFRDSPGTDAADTAFTDDPEQDGRQDRENNYLFELHQSQAERLVGKSLDYPLPDLSATAQWIFAKALLRGVDSIRWYRRTGRIVQRWTDNNGVARAKIVPTFSRPTDFAGVLREFFPRLRLPDIAKLKSLARNREDVIVTKRGKEYRDYLTLDEDTDPQRMLSRLYGAVPGGKEVALEMQQLYCDLVRGLKGNLAAGELPDPDKPDIRKYDFTPYAQRIANVYRIIKDTDITARAFLVRADRMRAYLRETGQTNSSRRKQRRRVA